MSNSRGILLALFALVVTAPVAHADGAARAPVTEKEARQAMMSASKTGDAHFSCYRNGNWWADVSLKPSDIVSLKITKANVDKDFAVVEVQLDARHQGRDGVMMIHGIVKLRYHWEAEWRLTERDSHDAVCQQKRQ